MRPPPRTNIAISFEPRKIRKKASLPPPPPSPFCQHCVFPRSMFEFRIRMCADEVRMHAVPWPRPSACSFVRTQAAKGRKVPKGNWSWPRTEAGVVKVANEVRCDIKILCGRGVAVIILLLWEAQRRIHEASSMWFDRRKIVMMRR